MLQPAEFDLFDTGVVVPLLAFLVPKTPHRFDEGNMVL